MPAQVLLASALEWVPMFGGGVRFARNQDLFSLGITKPLSNITGAGIIRPYPTRVVNGNVTLTAGQSLVDTIVNGKVSCQGAGWLIENCVIRGSAAGFAQGDWLVNTGSSAGGTIRFSNVNPQTPNAYTNGIGPRKYTAYRNEVWECTDCFSAFPTLAGVAVDVTIQGCYAHDMTRFSPDYATNNRAETHNDIFQSQGGSNIRITGNWFSAYHSTTKGEPTQVLPHIQIAAIMINNNIGDTTDIFVTKNWLDGGEFTVNAGAATGNPVITDNIFDYGARQFPDGSGTTYAISVKSTQNYIVSGNVYNDGVPVVRRNG